MAVRLDKDLKATIKKIVASYNRKINYYTKKGIQGLPSKTSYKEIVNLDNRRLIKKELASMQKLNSKTVDRIVYNNNLATIYERDYISKRLRSDKKILRARIKKLAGTEYKYLGQSTGVTMGDRLSMVNLTNAMRSGSLRNDKLISSLRKYERLSSISTKDYFSMTDKEKESFKALLNRIENPYINKKLKESYLESLTDLGYSYGYDKEKLLIMENRLKKLSNEEFEKLFSEDIGLQKVFSYYDIMKLNLGSNVLENKNEVFELYDNLFDNLDQLLSEYEK